MTVKNKLYIFDLLIAFVLMLSRFIFLGNTNIFLAFSFFLIFIFMYNIFGMERGNKKIKTITIETILIVILLYILFSMLIGLFIGFSENPILINLKSIFKNTFFIIIIILLTEMIRYIIAKRCCNTSIYPLVITTILFIIFDMLFLVNFFSNYTFFISLTTTIIPIIFRNILFSYLAYHVSFIPNFILRLFYAIYSYIFPILPNYNDYFISLINIFIPYLIYLLTSNNINYYEKTKISRNVNKKFWYLTIVVWFLLLMLIILITGLFKYQIMAIGSYSMTPNINYGDAVVFEKVRGNYLDLEKNDIIVFNYEGEVVVHRIVKIENINNDVVIETKGDNNKKKDKFKLSKKNVIGKVKFRIRFIGLPTVSLQEMFSK